VFNAAPGRYVLSMKPRPENYLLRAVGRNVRALRLKAKLTQEELASRAQIDAKHIQKIERGVANSELRTIARLAATFGVKANKLLT